VEFRPYVAGDFDRLLYFVADRRRHGIAVVTTAATDQTIVIIAETDARKYVPGSDVSYSRYGTRRV